MFQRIQQGFMAVGKVPTTGNPRVIDHTAQVIAQGLADLCLIGIIGCGGVFPD